MIENLRGPAIKLGCTVVCGHTAELPLIASRVKAVSLHARVFHRTAMFQGASYIKPPELPGNTELLGPRSSPPSAVGVLVLFRESDMDRGTVKFVPGARIMGPIDFVKGFLKGHKFSVLNCWHEFICVELV